jgi:hypothetical protein
MQEKYGDYDIPSKITGGLSVFYRQFLLLFLDSYLDPF